MIIYKGIHINTKRGLKKGTVLISPQERKVLNKLGKRIKEERTKRGWTLHETEEHGYPNWSHWQYIENGKKNINFTTLLKIAKTLKIKLSDLLDGI
jgi:ribosome-binding protein aMBF1 (putative translation factor)